MTVRVANDFDWPTGALDVKVMVPLVPALTVSDWVLAAVPFTARSRWILAPVVVPRLFVVSNVDVVPSRVMALLDEPREIAPPAVRTVPSTVTAGAVAVRPPVKVRTALDELPSVSVPVLFERHGVGHRDRRP